MVLGSCSVYGSAVLLLGMTTAASPSPKRSRYTRSILTGMIPDRAGFILPSRLQMPVIDGDLSGVVVGVAFEVERQPTSRLTL